MKKRLKHISKKRKFKFNRGSTSISIFLILALLVIAAFTMINGVSVTDFMHNTAPSDAQKVAIINSGDQSSFGNLQLKTLQFKPCSATLAVDFLVDVSGSMSSNNKIDRSIDAINTFTSGLPDNAVIGLQKFSDDTNNGPSGATSLVELGYYKDVKPMTTTINLLKNVKGSTWTRNGFQLAKQKISEAQSANKFPGYQYALVFISDGVPEYAPDELLNNCLVRVAAPEAGVPGATRCFSKTMDPRSPGPNIPQEIKDMGAKIFSIGIYNNSGSDGMLVPYLESLLKDAASDPDNTYYYSTFNPSDLTGILGKVATQICQ